MYKPSLNPTVIALTKSTRSRRINLGDLAPVREDGVLKCIWCLSILKGKQRKWCSPACGDSAYTWANPQSEYGLAFLLARQAYKCAHCSHDWNVLAHSLKGTRGIAKALNYLTTFSIRLLKSLKRQSPKGTKPEVDHVVPIFKGGESIGFENHQAICSACHKGKTKKDVSGKRK